MIGKNILYAITFALVGRCVAGNYKVERAQTQSQAYEYVAQRLGLSGKNTSLGQDICSALAEHNACVSLLTGFLLGVPLGGSFTQALSLTDTQNKIVTDVVGGLSVAGIVHVVIRQLKKHYVDAGASFSAQLTEFVKQWDKHQENTPEVLHAFFQRLHDAYKVNGKIMYNDTMVYTFYHVFAETFIDEFEADVEYVIEK